MSIIIIYLGLWSLTTSTVYLTALIFLWNPHICSDSGSLLWLGPLQLASFFEGTYAQSDPFQTFLITFSQASTLFP